MCVIAPVHTWDDVRVFQKEARSLADAGWNVSLIAQAPSARKVDGVNIVPAQAPKTPRWRRFICLPLVLRQAFRLRADVYHLHNPDTLPFALFLKCVGHKVVYDTHEDFTERIELRGWVPKPLRTMVAGTVGAAERIVGRFVDASIATEEKVVRRLGSRAVLIGNPPRYTPELVEKVKRLATDIKDGHEGLRAIYIGGLSKSRGLFDIVSALAIANERESVRLWFAGKVPEKELEKAKSLAGWRFVDYLGFMPQVKAFSYVARADVGLSTLQNVGGHSTADPNKIYEYMAFGTPFIVSNFPLWKEKFGPINAGYFFEPGNAESLAQQLVTMARCDPGKRQEMGARGQAYIASNHWGHEAKKLIKIYESIVT